MNMSIVESIRVSVARPTIDGMLLENATSEEISQAVAVKHNIAFEVPAIERYRQEMFKPGESPVLQLVKMTQDLSNIEPPPTDEFARLSAHFSFKKTNEDLELIYDRIRQLKQLADEDPENDGYDRRLMDCISKAEAIRTRVFRHQYEQIRHAILLTVGKKLCAAAISILMPYIHKEHRAEAMRRFQAAVEPLLDLKSVPDLPPDIAEQNPGA